MRIGVWLFFALLSLPLFGQTISMAPRREVPAEARYFRVIALVHLTGSGKHGDPIRPEYPSISPKGAPQGGLRDGILSWSMQLSDDGKMAIVHLVAANHKAFDELFNDKRGDLRVF